MMLQQRRFIVAVGAVLCLPSLISPQYQGDWNWRNGQKQTSSQQSGGWLNDQRSYANGQWPYDKSESIDPGSGFSDIQQSAQPRFGDLDDDDEDRSRQRAHNPSWTSSGFHNSASNLDDRLEDGSGYVAPSRPDAPIDDTEYVVPSDTFNLDRQQHIIDSGSGDGGFPDVNPYDNFRPVQPSIDVHDIHTTQPRQPETTPSPWSFETDRVQPEYNPPAKPPIGIDHSVEVVDHAINMMPSTPPPRIEHADSFTTAPSTTKAPGVPRVDNSFWAFFQRPFVLAGVIAGAVLALGTIILLVYLVANRVQKKDEGSYILDEPVGTKLGTAPIYSSYPYYAYQRAPSREFYA